MKGHHNYFTENEENMIKLQMGFKAFKSNSRCVAIHFNNNCELSVFKDDNSNSLILKISVDDLHDLLVKINGLNLDTPAFYSNFSQHTEYLFMNQHNVIGSDCYLIYDKELDSMNYNRLNNPRSRLDVLRHIEMFNLKYICYVNNPNSKKKFLKKKKEKPSKISHTSFLFIFRYITKYVFN